MGFSAVDALTKPFLQLHEWDNGAERIVHTTTIQILLCFLFVVSSNLMFGEPITCLMLPETPESSANYFHDFCFYQDKLRISNTAPVKRAGNQGTMTLNHQQRKEEVAVTYYQWTSFIIFLQVAMCLLPAMMWKFFGLHFFYGSDFAAIIRGFVVKEDDDKLDSVDVNTTMDAHATYRWLEHKKRDRFGMCATMTIYVLMKWMTFGSLLLQFYMMAKIYASGELLWGVHISYDLLNGVYKNALGGVFPQIVGCKTHRTQLGNIVNEFVMRCILPQNFINSKVFLFLYWWYVLAMLVSLFSAIQYTCMLFSARYQRYATKSLLPTQEFFLEQAGRQQHSVIPGDSDPLEFFVDYLGNDGYLLLQCANVPLSVVTARGFVHSLYKIVVIKGGMEEGPETENTVERSPVNNINGEGDRVNGGKENVGKKLGNSKSKDKMADSDSLQPLLYCDSTPSCSSDSYRGSYTPPLGKLLEEDE